MTGGAPIAAVDRRGPVDDVRYGLGESRRAIAVGRLAQRNGDEVEVITTGVHFH